MMQISRDRSKGTTIALVLVLTIAATLVAFSFFMVFSSYTAATVIASGASASVNQAVEGIPPLESFWGA